SYAPGVPFSLHYPDLPLFSLLEDAARNWGQHTAAICFESQTTYAQFLTRSHQFGHALTSLGVKRGDRVGILLPNVPEYIVAACGTWMIGATVVQMSPLLVEDEIRKLLEMTGCRVVVTLDMLSPPLVNLLGHGLLQQLILTSLDQHLGMLDRWLYPIELFRRGVPLRNGRNQVTIDFDKLLEAQPSHAPRARVQPDRDAAIIQPTGGTTGSPKAVVLTHRNLLANVLQLKAWRNSPDGQDSLLAVLPFFHCYGLTVVMFTTIASAGTMVLCPRFKPRTVAKLIGRHRPNILPGVPALYAALNSYLKTHPIDLSSVELALSGASSLDAQVRREFEGHGIRKLVEAYGLSEASPVTHCNPLQQGDRPGTIGLPLPDTLARVVDLETGQHNLPPEQPGELVVRGPQVMAGYMDDAEATAQVIRDGWLFTGDIATYDADGFFRIVDRKKDLIKTSGYNVFPIEVEEIIRQHPGVSDVAVVGVPDPARGELVKAFVILRPQSGITVALLERFCQERMAKHKQPRQIELCDELPRNFLGKVLRRQLREDPR
ncbi:MAG: long-chain fatty acid--CoA ligase, partial [Planctomycetes bacterium]|nr:long-chain fatty acid--CoA ligase [Planctomycetota bacterium]